MELALALGGMTVEELEERMTERELHGWMHFMSRRRWPMRRFEMYLAQIAHVVASTMGVNKTLTVQDFIYSDRDPEAESAAAHADGAAQAFGFAPKLKKKG